MPRSRLAVALLVPPPVAGEIDGLRRALGDGARERVPPHLTLVPPVNVTDTRLGEALALVRRAAAATVPLGLALGPAATFHPVTPVVYLAVGGDLDRLHALRDGLAQPPLQRSLTHAFVAHVTLAEELAPARIPGAVAALADFRVEVGVDRVHLLREEAGRVWRPLADAPFAEPAVVGRGGLELELTVSDGTDPEAAGLLAASAALPDGRPFAVTARRDGSAVGLACGWTAASTACLTALVVADRARREGVGRHLLAAVENLARSRGCASLTAVMAPVEGLPVAAVQAGEAPPPAGEVPFEVPPPATVALLIGAGWRPATGTGPTTVWHRQLAPG
jgi:2'-5' RNA ligase